MQQPIKQHSLLSSLLFAAIFKALLFVCLLSVVLFRCDVWTVFLDDGFFFSWWVPHEMSWDDIEEANEKLLLKNTNAKHCRYTLQRFIIAQHFPQKNPKPNPKFLKLNHFFSARARLLCKSNCLRIIPISNNKIFGILFQRKWRWRHAYVISNERQVSLVESHAEHISRGNCRLIWIIELFLAITIHAIFPELWNGSSLR